MRADILNRLLLKLEACTAPPEAIAEFRQMIHEVDASHGRALSPQEQRVEFARRKCFREERKHIINELIWFLPGSINAPI